MKDIFKKNEIYAAYIQNCWFNTKPLYFVCVCVFFVICLVEIKIEGLDFPA